MSDKVDDAVLRDLRVLFDDEDLEDVVALVAESRKFNLRTEDGRIRARSFVKEAMLSKWLGLDSFSSNLPFERDRLSGGEVDDPTEMVKEVDIDWWCGNFTEEVIRSRKPNPEFWLPENWDKIADRLNEKSGPRFQETSLEAPSLKCLSDDLEAPENDKWMENLPRDLHLKLRHIESEALELLGADKKPSENG